MSTGCVYWITGFPGSGKTTIGTKLYYYLKKTIPQVVLLDGDVIKNLFKSETVDYSRDGRKKRAFQYAELCKLLAGQGITVICCTIAMFDEVREWNRTHIPGYFEIFVDVDLEVLMTQDRRGLYERRTREKVSVIDDAELPKHPDITIHNTMDNNINEYVEEILFCSSNVNISDNTSFSYWNTYYKTANFMWGEEKPSDFAAFALKYMKNGKKLIDLGCGNGRDSIYFCKNEIKVTAIDLSLEAIKLLNLKSLPIFAICDDFVITKALFCVDYDYCYARWSIHAINNIQQNELIVNVDNALQRDGLFFIEARTINDTKYGLGKSLGKDEFFYDGHYRRFIRPNELIEQLTQKGFDIVYFQESDTFSVVEEDAPALLRVVARKL